MKKSFIDSIENPAEVFISAPTAAKPQGEQPPQGFKPNPEYIETRSKRVQLLMQPSLYKQLKARAKREKRSLNDLVHSILEENAERK
ncbi:MAG: hypothetical protein VZR27_13100 [Acutalibacteraceae bacterium]|nr:hypothetical protein [Acutalibacteraceae bacterium]